MCIITSISSAIMVNKLYLFLSFIILMGKTSGNTHQNLCDPVTINCICAKTNHVQLKLEANVTERLENGEIKCSGYPDPHQACENITCFFVSEDAEPFLGENNFIFNFYPKTFNVSAEDGDGGHRFKRQEEPCQVTPLKNANIKCWRWPNWLKCDMKCIHGHALQDNGKSLTSKSLNCRKTENVWKPDGFVDCLPYLNCNVLLVKPGDLKCKQPANGPAYCDISCHAFEHYEAVSHQRYKCMDENFARILPHCARLNEFVHLVEKP